MKINTRIPRDTHTTLTTSGHTFKGCQGPLFRLGDLYSGTWTPRDIYAATETYSVLKTYRRQGLWLTITVMSILYTFTHVYTHIYMPTYSSIFPMKTSQLYINHPYFDRDTLFENQTLHYRPSSLYLQDALPVLIVWVLGKPLGGTYSWQVYIPSGKVWRDEDEDDDAPSVLVENRCYLTW